MMRLIFLLLFSISALAQTSPFLPEDLYNKLNNELSGDIAFDHLRTLTQFHVPSGGAGDFMKEANWIAAKAKEYGLEDVRILELPYREPAWTPKSGELWLLDKDGKETKLGSFEEVATSIADNSRPTNATAELIDVGEGISERDYEGKDVKGKIVLANGSPTLVEKEAVWKRGALGIVSYYSNRVVPSDYPDQITWTRINQKADAEGHEPSFGFIISYRAGMALKRRLNAHFEFDPLARKSVEVPAETLRARVTIESEFSPTSTQHMVEGWIRGSKIHDQQIVLTAHIQEEKFSANDDRSGCANQLEVGRALVKMIREGKLERPVRDIRFWWTNEIDSPYDYFGEHPEEVKNTFANINQDMVGVNQTIGGLSRVQHVMRTPWSRPTFMNDVIESIIMSLYYGNNSYIAARQAQSTPAGSHYSRPIFSRLGTRDRYSVEITPFFNNTDAMPFNDAWTAAVHGGTTFTNFPDEYIHSSGDDMWQMDPTTFKRNAVAVTAITWFMANAGTKESGTVAGMFTRGARKRMANDLQNVVVAQRDGNAFLWDYMNVNAQSVRREQDSAESLRSIGADSTLVATIKQMLFDSRETLAITPGAATPPKGFEPNACSESFGCVPNNAPKELTVRIPTRTASIAEYRKKEHDLKRPKGLHSLMAFEALNFIDGKRSMWDIYAACRAESLAGGEWYYGTVTPEAIKEYLESAAKLGLISLKEAPAPAPAKTTVKKKK
ncbi:MAG TPA: M28 family metallopeptidase [Terriglobales bacterium]|nr:M28 family metallopeptidase [Terriglobales bacterium]